MIDNIEVLKDILFNSFKENELELQKIDNINIASIYYVNEIKVNTLLRIVFNTCSSHHYCFSISREQYGQIKVILFDKSSNDSFHFILFTIKPNKINRFLKNLYDKKISFFNKISIIPIIGPDGVGKSTLLDEVINQLEEKIFFKRFKKVVRNSIIYNIFHPFNKDSVRKKVGKKSVKNQHDDIHYLLCIIGALSAYPYLIFQTLFKKSIVLLDRFFYDYLLENISLINESTILRKNWKILLRIIPKTYFLIHLDADAEIILSRKQELSADDIDKYRELNFKLYLEKPSIVYTYINTGLEIEQCKNIILFTLSSYNNLKKGSHNPNGSFK